MKATAEAFMSSASTWCWAKKPTRKRGFWLMRPFVGVSWPISSFRTVVFPAPLGPTMPMRESSWTSRSMFRRRGLSTL